MQFLHLDCTGLIKVRLNTEHTLSFAMLKFQVWFSVCLAHPGNASAPEKAQCAQSPANEKSNSSTGTKL